MKWKEILNQPEGRKIEFKSTLPSHSDLNKTIVAFANDAGGELYIGINDNPRKVLGIKENDLISMEEQISSSIHDNCSPIILPEIMFLTVEGKHILVIKIHKGSNPPYHLKSKGIQKGTYIRVGSSNRLANKDIIEELERRKRNISFDALPVYAKDLHKVNFHSFKKQYEEITGEKLTETVLKKLNLWYDEQGNKFPTKALLLLSDDSLRTQLFPYAKIECARFKGIIPGNFIDQKTIDAPLSLQAEQAYKFVLRHISQGSEYEGVYRKDRWEYPIIAIREAIRNAVIHRDYSLTGKDIKIAIFDDKIEITSPGKLLPTVDFDDMESGQSDIRNKTLAPVFKKLGIIEQWGNGLKLIAEEMENYPEIELQWKEPGMDFRISFVKKNFDTQSKIQAITTNDGRLSVERISEKPDYERLRTITNDYERLDDNEIKVLLYILDNKTITRKIAVGLLNLQNTKTYEILNALVHKRLLLRKGKGRSTYYCLIQDGGSNE
jgi:ATP-dependent DNA helicase RecG